jgi:hypothetical protein
MKRHQFWLHTGARKHQNLLMLFDLETENVH